MTTKPSGRVVITGMGVNTPLGDELGTFYKRLLSGTSAITNWKFFEHAGVYSKVGGDLSDYDATQKVKSLEGKIPAEMHARLRKFAKKAPFSTRLVALTAIDSWLDAGLGFEGDKAAGDRTRQSVIVAGHNLNERYLLKNYGTFLEEPDWIDGMAALHNLDTDHAGTIGDVLGSLGALYTMGGACASGNIALRNAVDEIRHHGHNVVVVAGSPLDFSDMGLHAMTLMDAITYKSFNDDPQRASRPYDTNREGFVPSHGAATLVVESLEHAEARGARIYAELLGCTAMSDGSHLPTPSPEGQARTITRLLEETRIEREQVDFICAHATSTPMGDLSELRAIKTVFGDHAKKLKINAPKSMLGHTCWSAPLVETVAALLQMQGEKLHPSINIDKLDPEVDLEVCANEAVSHRSNIILKNSFGFGGINCCALYRRFN